MEIPKLEDKLLIELSEITPEDIQTAIDVWRDEFGDTDYELLLEAD